jgi:hypothetical protein
MGQQKLWKTEVATVEEKLKCERRQNAQAQQRGF